ncbi:hypothetical protein KUCAC02_017364, partial [Chaenocephalus aceratus]
SRTLRAVRSPKWTQEPAASTPSTQLGQVLRHSVTTSPHRGPRPPGAPRLTHVPPVFPGGGLLLRGPT